MKINFETNVTNLDGKEIKDEKGKEVTFAFLVIDALLANDKELNGKQKIIRFELAQKVYSKSQEYTVEEAALIKEIAGKLLSTIVVGFLFQLIDGKLKTNE